MDQKGMEKAMQWCRRTGMWEGREEQFLHFAKMLQVITSIFASQAYLSGPDPHDLYQEVAIDKKDLSIAQEIGM